MYLRSFGFCCSCRHVLLETSLSELLLLLPISYWYVVSSFICLKAIFDFHVDFFYKPLVIQKYFVLLAIYLWILLMFLPLMISSFIPLCFWKIFDIILLVLFVYYLFFKFTIAKFYVLIFFQGYLYFLVNNIHIIFF